MCPKFGVPVKKLFSSGDKSEMTTFLKQIGSNHILINKCFSFSPKNPFQILCERRGTRRELTSSNLLFPNWRNRRDSNPRDLSAYALSKRAHSTAMRRFQTLKYFTIFQNILENSSSFRIFTPSFSAVLSLEPGSVPATT